MADVAGENDATGAHERTLECAASNVVQVAPTGTTVIDILFAAPRPGAIGSAKCYSTYRIPAAYGDQCSHCDSSDKGIV